MKTLEIRVEFASQRLPEGWRNGAMWTPHPMDFGSKLHTKYINFLKQLVNGELGQCALNVVESSPEVGSWSDQGKSAVS